MVIPTGFAIHVTYTCPIACAHCAFSSGPNNPVTLPIDHIIETIKSLDASTIKVVTFTGGEPFLLGQKLIRAVDEASRRGFITRVVTNAYFALDLTTARSSLSKLYNSGLHELFINWDDYHAQFISFACIHNAYWTAKKLGLKVAIYIVQANNSSWTPERVKHELGGDVSVQHHIIESPLNKTGRAEYKLRHVGPSAKRILGPCHYVLAAPTLSAKNKLLACCGFIPETKALVLDHHFDPKKLNALIAEAKKSLLLNWIFLRGPYAIMEWISRRYRIPIIDSKKVGGNCEACHRLFSNRILVSKIPYALTENPDEIVDELQLLRNLGIITPEAIHSLWKDTATITHMAVISD
ncbi:MAG: radical SAM protein [Thermodesulfobacteriota bacterium]